MGGAFDTATGVVTTFDDRIGAGTVVRDDDGTSLYFHCTRIADGSRTIAVSTHVVFEVEPGPTGLEAVALRPA